MNGCACLRVNSAHFPPVRPDPPSPAAHTLSLETPPRLHPPLARQAELSKRIHRRPLISALLLALALAAPNAWAASGNDSSPVGDRAETFGANTLLGRLSYQAGRGLRIGETGLVLGGFATAEAERLERGEGSGDFDEGENSEDSDGDEGSGASEGGKSRGELEGLNLFVFYDPVPFAHLFTELEVGPLLELESGEGTRSDPKLEVDRLYLDLATSDALKLRVGKFLTPIGRWNVASAEPLLWTTSEPLIVEEVFDENATGAMLHGSAFPSGGALSYSLYGQFLNPIDPDRDENPAEHSAGAHLEWASLEGWTVGASYFASEIEDGEWNHLGGADLLWQPNTRIEISGEVLFGEGSREDGTLSGLYLQGVVETVRTLYAVARYERFDPPGAGRAVDLFDLGLAWAPAPYLRLKADYLFADERGELDDLAEPGFRMSLSILF